MLHQVLLTIYIFILFLYSLYKNINYKTMTYVFNTLLFCLLMTSTYNLCLYQQNQSTLSSLKLNNVFLPTTILTFYFDQLTWIFLFTIYTISFVVHKYQFTYLKDSPFKENFLIFFNSFILSMVGVVITSHWLVLLLSWELLGLSSFFLIGYYKNKPAAMKSAFKAFFFNKLSDLFLLIAFIFYYITYNTFYICNQPSVTTNYELISLFITLTAFIKSAQFCFYFWLPDSMEAPIPASALIHSATLVSAGIYLTLRFNEFTAIANYTQNLLLIPTTITIILTSVIAANQTDIKKMLAYSTIANCGFIYLLIYLKTYKLALIYFTLHGIVKSFCFIIAGDIILVNNHIQDIRKWVNFPFFIKLKLLFLICLLFFLSSLPISSFYLVKSTLFISSYTNIYTQNWVFLTILLYTLSSYIYGIKILYFFCKKKLIYKKYKTYRNLKIIDETSLIFIIYLFILITVLVCVSHTIIPVKTFNWVLITSSLLSIILILYTKTTNELMFLQGCIFFFVILSWI